MLQEQALHAVHSILMLVDKDTCPRPEKQPGLQVSQALISHVHTQFCTPSELYFVLVLNFVFIFVYKMDMMTSMKALNKTVEAAQLTSDLGGTFTYSHTDWLQFHQVPDIFVFSQRLQLWLHST